MYIHLPASGFQFCSRQRQEKRFSFAIGAFAFFRLFFFLLPRFFSFASAKKARVPSSDNKQYVCTSSKVSIRNLSPHLRNSPILRTTKSIAELRSKKSCDCGPPKFDLCNSATLRSLLPIPLLSRLFSLAQDGFKSQPKIFLELHVSLENKNLP